MTRRTRWLHAALVAALLPLGSACAEAVDALTSHARPVAEVAGEELTVVELATLMAESPLPDSALTSNWARQIGLLWADYVSLVLLYQAPDTTASLDYEALLRNAGYLAALAVQRYRDSVVLAGIEPTDEELREWFQATEPLTRLDVRRIRLDVPEGATGAERDSLYEAARRLRARVAGGADFIEVARSASDEPPAARGQVLAYQGHADFHPAADSVVFRLRPGEISPVISTDDAMVFYRIERRRAPELETVEDIVRREMIAQRSEQRLSEAASSLLEDSRRVVADGAENVARTVASSESLARDGVPGSLRLVRFEGGALTVRELRLLFEARPDMRTRFEEADDEDIGIFLYQLAGDEVLIRAATESGVGLSEEERANLRTGIAGQLAAIAKRMDISHRLVANPRFDVGPESREFIRRVLAQAAPVPTATEFRPILDQRYPSRVDPRSAEAAAQQALRLRETSAGAEAAELNREDEVDRGGTSAPDGETE